MPIKVSRADKAWLAGIIDGEGCILLRPMSTSGYHICRLMITNTDEGILCEVKRILGEWLVFYCIQRNSKSKKPCFVIEVNRQMEAKFVLEQILPYLKSVKKQKAELFLEFLEQKKRKDGRRSNARKKVVQYSYLRV